MRAASLLALLSAFAACGVRALIVEVDAGRTRCLQEVLGKHELVKASYRLLEEPAEGERSGFLIKVSCCRFLPSLATAKSCFFVAAPCLSHASTVSVDRRGYFCESNLPPPPTTTQPPPLSTPLFPAPRLRRTGLGTQ